MASPLHNRTNLRKASQAWLAGVLAVSALFCLAGYLALHRELGWFLAFKSIAALYALCFAPGFLAQQYIFRVRHRSHFESCTSSLLLGLFLTPLAWYSLCWANLADLFPPLVLVASVAVTILIVRRPVSASPLEKPCGLIGIKDTPILWLSLALAILWSYSNTVVEFHNGYAEIRAYGDHSFHVSLIAELSRGVPPKAVPFVAGAQKIGYHLIPDVWCELLRRACNTDVQTAYFDLALTFRYLFVSLACYLALVTRFGRLAALAGVLVMFTVVGYTQDEFLSNILLGYFHASYPTSFGLTGLFLILFYVGRMDIDRPRAPLFLASLLSAMLLWFKANYALAVVPAVGLLALWILVRRKDYRWWLLCVGTQMALIVFRLWQLSSADFAQTLTYRPLSFLVWWWDFLKAPPGWPSLVLTHIKTTVEALPSPLTWPAVLAVCLVHRFHLGLIVIAYLIYRSRRYARYLGARPASEQRNSAPEHLPPAAPRPTARVNVLAANYNFADALTLLILLTTFAGFVFFPDALGPTGNVSVHLWFMAFALMISLMGSAICPVAIRMFRSGKIPAFATVTLVVAALAYNAPSLRSRALWETRRKSDKLSIDLYDCYRYVEMSTPLDALVLQPQLQGWNTAGMLTQRRLVMEREHTWKYFWPTKQTLVDARKFFDPSSQCDAREMLKRYGVDYVVVDLSSGWRVPDETLLEPLFERETAVVYRVHLEAPGRLSETYTDAAPQ